MPAFVLVRPSLPENLGAAARVLANFGLHDLRVVDPQLPMDHARALATATHGAPVLARATVHADLRDALADRTVVLATAARGHGPALDPVDGVARLRAPEERAALVFGPERTGLSLDELSLADAVIRIPTDPSCPALNLAQAVAVLAWEWARPSAPPAPRPRPPRASRGALHGLFAHLEARLDRAGFLPSSHRAPMTQHLRALILRARPSEQEVRTLRGVIAALSRLGEEPR